MESKMREKSELVKKLQKQVDALQGFGRSFDRKANAALGPLCSAFPDGAFPRATVHEFISYELPQAASTSGFIAALASTFTPKDGLCLWVNANKRVFPPALRHFGLHPEHILFVDPPNWKDTLWTIEEALKCDALTTVMGEVRELGFTESRRLQLAVERSGVTCFIHRHRPLSQNNVASATRWLISPLSGNLPDGLPGVGLDSWNVELLKLRNGIPGVWQVSWSEGKFVPMLQSSSWIETPKSGTG